MMNALTCQHLSDDLSGVQLLSLPVPVPGPGEVRIRVHAASLNFPDLLMSRGLYQLKPPTPFILGMECAGVIDALGDEVTGWQCGDAVVGARKTGAFAQYLVMPAEELVRKPAAFRVEQAAAYPVTYLTACVALIRRARLQAGETLLVHGGGGGVGMACVDVGKLLGATVIATCTADLKRDAILAQGADHVLPVSGGFRDAVKSLTDGRGADVIVDPVGGDVFDESVRCIAFDGRLLVIGFTSGRIPTISANLPLIKGFSVVGVRAGEYGRHFPARGAQDRETIWRWANEGRTRPHVHAAIPLAQWRSAFGLMMDRTVVGKVVLTMD